MNGAVVICSSTTLINTASATKDGWTGGRASLVVNASAYGTNLHLEYRSEYGAAWVRAHTSNITANQVMSLYAPAGQYRMAVTGSTAVSLTAVLVGIPY